MHKEFSCLNLGLEGAIEQIERVTDSELKAEMFTKLYDATNAEQQDDMHCLLGKPGLMPSEQLAVMCGYGVLEDQQAFDIEAEAYIEVSCCQICGEHIEDPKKFICDECKAD